VTGTAGLLEMEGVSYETADGTRLLDHVSLRAERGRITVLAGPSGAGKSTLLRLANRLAVPSAGIVRLDGVDCATLDSRHLRRRVGMVFQRPTPFAGTVADNLRVARPELDDAGALEALRRVGLSSDMVGRRADDLSGGEAQRMCLARTLLTEPEVVLMDEPTSSLDPDSRLAIERVVSELVRDGLAVVWVTHDLAQARRLADHTVVLLAGRNATDAEAEAYLAEREDER